MKEIERKWLCDKKLIPSDMYVKQSIHIYQAYLSYEPEVRIRSINKEMFFKTEKSEGNLIREEKEIAITREEFHKLKKDIKCYITKERYNYKGYEVDVFDSFIMAEKEFSTENEAMSFIPNEDWIGEEVTNDKNYKNKNIARKYSEERLLFYSFSEKCKYRERDWEDYSSYYSCSCGTYKSKGWGFLDECNMECCREFKKDKLINIAPDEKTTIKDSIDTTPIIPLWYTDIQNTENNINKLKENEKNIINKGGDNMINNMANNKLNGEVKLTIDGNVVVKRDNGDYVRYDQTKDKIINYCNIIVEGSENMCVLMPVANVEALDILKYKEGFVQVINVDKNIQAINLLTGEKVTIIKEESLMGFNFYNKVVNIMSGNMNPMTLMTMQNGSMDNNLMQMMIMSQYMSTNNSTTSNISPMMLMAMQGQSNTNPNNMLQQMMMYQMLQNNN